MIRNIIFYPGYANFDTQDVSKPSIHIIFPDLETWELTTDEWKDCENLIEDIRKKQEKIYEKFMELENENRNAL